MEFEIIFKSTEDNFKKESSDVKRNTVRIVSIEEDESIQACMNYLIYVKIINIETEHNILRELTDITRFESHGLIIYIFSW